jgi:hypothetical protein
MLRPLPLRLLAVVAALPLAACSATVTTSECDDPPPAAECGVFECVDGDWVFDEGSCDVCPGFTPFEGEACSAEGQSCDYPGEVPCGPPDASITMQCIDGAWKTIANRCTLPECPIEQPAIGSDCGSYPTSTVCSFFVACETSAALNLACVDDGTGPRWSPVDPGLVCGTCEAAADPTACAANPGCAWQVPGCGDGSLPAIAEGCYPAEDCSTSLACSDPAQQCVVTVVDPCWNSMCDACGMQTGVCVTP